MKRIDNAIAKVKEWMVSENTTIYEAHVNNNFISEINGVVIRIHHNRMKLEFIEYIFSHKELYDLTENLEDAYKTVYSVIKDLNKKQIMWQNLFYDLRIVLKDKGVPYVIQEHITHLIRYTNGMNKWLETTEIPKLIDCTILGEYAHHCSRRVEGVNTLLSEIAKRTSILCKEVKEKEYKKQLDFIVSEVKERNWAFAPNMLIAVNAVEDTYKSRQDLRKQYNTERSKSKDNKEANLYKIDTLYLKWSKAAATDNRPVLVHARSFRKVKEEALHKRQSCYVLMVATYYDGTNGDVHFITNANGYSAKSQLQATALTCEEVDKVIAEFKRKNPTGEYRSIRLN